MQFAHGLESQHAISPTGFANIREHAPGCNKFLRTEQLLGINLWGAELLICGASSAEVTLSVWHCRNGFFASKLLIDFLNPQPNAGAIFNAAPPPPFSMARNICNPQGLREVSGLSAGGWRCW